MEARCYMIEPETRPRKDKLMDRAHMLEYPIQKTAADDTRLMLRVQNGDEAAFREILNLYQRSILNLCFRYVGNQQDAEEVAQDTFIHLYRSAAGYRPTAKLSTYLYRIAVNLSLNRIRDRKRKRLFSLDALKSDRNLEPVHPDGSPEGQMEHKEMQENVRRVLDRLPENQKTAVMLKRFEGLSYDEIAEVMQCSVSAVESLLHRAKMNLRKNLKSLMD
jgi:RNA polymerase sigma-70 factor (family 1)